VCVCVCACACARARVLHVEYAERGNEYGILFIFSMICENTRLEYVRIHVVYRAYQAIYVIHIRVVAPQEYVITYSTRRVCVRVRVRVCVCVVAFAHRRRQIPSSAQSRTRRDSVGAAASARRSSQALSSAHSEALERRAAGLPTQPDCVRKGR